MYVCVFQMNFYKYQNKLMSICEKNTFKCTECYRSFSTPTDLQCHVYEHQHQTSREPSSSVPESKECVKQENVTAGCGEPADGEGAAEDDGGTDAEKPIKVESHDGRVNVKTEKPESEERDDGENEEEDGEEELIDVGVNNRTEGNKSRADDNADAGR